MCIHQWRLQKPTENTCLAFAPCPTGECCKALLSPLSLPSSLPLSPIFALPFYFPYGRWLSWQWQCCTPQKILGKDMVICHIVRGEGTLYYFVDFSFVVACLSLLFPSNPINDAHTTAVCLIARTPVHSKVLCFNPKQHCHWAPIGIRDEREKERQSTIRTETVFSVSVHACIVLGILQATRHSENLNRPQNSLYVEARACWAWSMWKKCAAVLPEPNASITWSTCISSRCMWIIRMYCIRVASVGNKATGCLQISRDIPLIYVRPFNRQFLAI